MAKKEPNSVTMRVRIGDNELEVTGPTAFVEKKISEFLEKQKNLPAHPSQPSGPRVDQPPTGSTSKSKKMSIAQFFKRVEPKTDVDRALAAGYFLETFSGEENFTAAEVRETIQSAKISPPKNPSDAVAKNIKKGFLMAAGDKEGKKAYVLTTDGEDAIKQSLNP